MVSTLKRIAPLFGSKGSASATEQLVALLAEHQAAGGPEVAVKSLQAVFDRGLASWRPTVLEIGAEQWALGRTKAFLMTAAGQRIPGYTADRDLLPAGHPLAWQPVPVDVAPVAVPAQPTVDTPAPLPPVTPHVVAQDVTKLLEQLRQFTAPRAER
jgi:hypothetical protein